LRKVCARTKSALDDAIANCCAALTRTECENFFTSCGYGIDYSRINSKLGNSSVR
jgi:hypothetical protein